VASLLTLQLFLLGSAVSTSDGAPRDGVGSARGVPFPAGGILRLRLLPFAPFHSVCSLCSRLSYIADRGVVPHLPVGLPYVVYYCFARPDGPFGGLPWKCPFRREAFRSCFPFACPFYVHHGVLHVDWF
jgi:hypothetical protein